MKWLIVLLLLASCTSVTTIERDDAGQITTLTQPRQSLVELPGEIVVDSRKVKEPGFLSTFGIGLGSRVGSTITGG